MEREARQELDKRGRHIPLMYVIYIPLCVIMFGVCSNEISFSFKQKKNTNELAKKADSPYDSLDIPADWLNVSGDSVDVRLCQVAYQEQEHCPPLVVIRSPVINTTHQTWRLHVHGHLLDPSNISSLADVPVTLDGNAASLLLENLSQLKTCVGKPEEKFVSLGKK